MLSKMPLGCSATGTGLKGFSSSTLAGTSGLASRNSFLTAPASRVSISGGPLRRQAGGDVFGAFDFVRVPFFEDVLRAALLRHHVRAGLDGFTVGFLRIGAEAAFGAETHSAAAPRKIFITHSQYPFRWMYTFCIKPSAINEHSTEDPP